MCVQSLLSLLATITIQCRPLHSIRPSPPPLRADIFCSTVTNSLNLTVWTTHQPRDLAKERKFPKNSLWRITVWSRIKRFWSVWSSVDSFSLWKDLLKPWGHKLWLFLVLASEPPGVLIVFWNYSEQWNVPNRLLSYWSQKHSKLCKENLNWFLSSYVL